jgi:hypothetical protein
VRNKWNKGRDVHIQAFLLATMDARLTTSAMTRSASSLVYFWTNSLALSAFLGLQWSSVAFSSNHCDVTWLPYQPPEREDGLCFGRKMGMEKEGMLQDSGGKIKHFNKRYGYVLLC